MASDKVNYLEVGSIAQAIKISTRAGTFWPSLSGSEKESLDQIATAIARTVAGDGVHWDGIMAYADCAKPGTDAPTIDIERGIRSLVRDIPTRNGAT